MKPEPTIELLTGEISLAISRSIVLIGRHPECDLQLNHAVISRRHCCIILADNDLYIRDLGSRHGVWVNGERVTERRLQHHDQVAIGISFFRVLIPGGDLQTDLYGTGDQGLPAAIDVSASTDLETMMPEGSQADSAGDLKSDELDRAEMVFTSETGEAAAGDQSISESEAIVENDLEVIAGDSPDSGYEPLFDLKL